MPRELPKHVRRKVSKGHTYYYFDTGTKIAGKAVFKRLPDIRDPDFGRMLAAAQSGRTRRGTVKGPLTLAGLADLYERSPEFRGLAKTTQRSYQLNLDKARKRLGIAPADELRPSDVRLVHDEMADQTGAANQFVRVLGSLFSWARKRGHVSAKPVDGVELFDETPHEPWPEWLLKEALADESVRLPVALLYYTAQRIGDVCRMRWSDVREGVIAVKQQKTGKALAIPFHVELTKLLAAAPKTGLTILNRGGKPYREAALREMIQEWASKRDLHVVPHGLRKNAVIALLEADCSIAETAAISGQTLQMVEHYAQRRNQAKLASAAILRWNQSGTGKRGAKK
jgi:integrase